ncbi:hypothetical protein L6164_015815 [Bauhinia variegata]|uniref:Uncharacterized protein n=1 Tax=Bauhinia variegata TaxID=167791 RepID=A0ACB9NN25_BAUVA|nr:hypothetical protein L6164_015815 [Bauhinia variegata]
MHNSQNQGQGQAPTPLPVAEPQSQPQSLDGEEEDELIAKAHKLMDNITSAPDNPKPIVLHALATILEKQELRYMEDNGYSSFNVGRLGSLIRENDEFFELISRKFLSETRYTTSIQAVAARLLLCCSLTWI